MVVAGLLLGHSAPVIQTASSRVAERMNWRTIAFVLENTVFLLIGLQASWIVADLRGSDLPAGEIVLVCLAALVAVVALRMLWVFPARYALGRAEAGPTGGDPAPWTHTVLLGWAGMRGVVTLDGQPVAGAGGRRVHFPWADAYAALRARADGAASPFDDVLLEYLDPSTGRSLLPTVGCYLQMLRPGVRTQAHRETSSAVYHVVEHFAGHTGQIIWIAKMAAPGAVRTSFTKCLKPRMTSIT